MQVTTTDALTFGTLYGLLGAPTTAALQFAASREPVRTAYVSRGRMCYEDVPLHQLAGHGDCWAGYSQRTNCVYCYVEDEATA
jgi:hypothetical protein